jgi:hypothetical protein
VYAFLAVVARELDRYAAAEAWLRVENERLGAELRACTGHRADQRCPCGWRYRDPVGDNA